MTSLDKNQWICKKMLKNYEEKVNYIMIILTFQLAVITHICYLKIALFLAPLPFSFCAPAAAKAPKDLQTHHSYPLDVPGSRLRCSLHSIPPPPKQNG